LITNTLNGCTVETSVTVLENIALPTVDAGVGFQLNCSVLDGNLNGTATPAQVTSSWTTLNGKIESGANSLSPKVSKAGNYSLLVTRTDNGCTKTDNVQVTEETNKPTDIQVLLTVPRCDGNVGKIEFSVVDGGIQPYLYSIDGGLHYSSDSIFQSIEPGAYALVVQDVHGCTWSEPLDVPAPVAPTVNILPEITLELGDSLVLDADLGAFPVDLVDTVKWTPLDYLRFNSLTLPDLLHPTVLPLKSTRYKIVVVSDAGCTATAFTNVKVDKTRHVFIPNVISPWNNNGENDKLIIFADAGQVIEIQAFELFDRWGDKIWSNYNFQPNVPAEGWGAVVRSQKLTPGVFVYWAKILFIDGKVGLYKGDVTIVK
jgi:CHU_C Type IX secretion signal domain